MKEFKICENCGKEFDINDLIEINEELYCEDCVNDLFITCDNCGEYELRCNAYEVGNGIVCEYCYDNYYGVCNHCGQVVNYDDLEDSENGLVCSDCRYWNYIYCSECETYVYNDNYNDDAEMCYRCSEELGYDLIGSYHSHDYNPIGRTDKKRNLWYKGIELEIDKNNDCDRLTCAKELNEVINKDIERIYFENDGSLDNGFEIITQPHRIDDNSINWSHVMNICSKYDYKSHDCGTCGLHLHYDRNFFGTTETARTYNIGKVIALYERFFDDFLKASRRTEEQYRNWARRYYEYDEKNIVKSCNKIVKNEYPERYHAVNLAKHSTIEFRLCRGTLNIDSFNAWNDLHDCIIKNVKKAKYKNIDNLKVWFRGIKPETIRYLHSKNAFLNFTI